MNWTCNSIGYNVLVNYIYIYMFWSDLNFQIRIFYGKTYYRGVLELTAPTNENHRGSCCYKPPLQIEFIGAVREPPLSITDL